MLKQFKFTKNLFAIFSWYFESVWQAIDALESSTVHSTVSPHVLSPYSALLILIPHHK